MQATSYLAGVYTQWAGGASPSLGVGCIFSDLDNNGLFRHWKEA